jgi:hypothetical protein
VRDKLPWHWPYPEGYPFWDEPEHDEEGDKRETLARWAEELYWKHRRMETLAREPSLVYVRAEYAFERMGIPQRMEKLERRRHYYGA